jgi:hypothetical protein
MTNSDAEYENQRFLVIRRFRDLPDAFLFESMLDSAGVECFLAEENTIRMDWLWSNLLGGIKLCVRKSEADEASSLLEQPILDRFDVEGIGEFQQPRCPNCNSLEISFQGLNRPVDYTRALFGGPRPLHCSLWECDFCGHQWSESKEKPPANFLISASSILMIVWTVFIFLVWLVSLTGALRSAASR